MKICLQVSYISALMAIVVTAHKAHLSGIVMKKTTIYMLGVILLGISYASVKTALSNAAIFAGLAVAYLLSLRIIAERFGKK